MSTDTEGGNENIETTEDDWAAAMAEQDDAAASQTGETPGAETTDDTAEAPPEPSAVEPIDANQTVGEAAESALFKPLTDDGPASASRDLDMIMDIPITLSVELGQTRLTIRELLDLAKGSIVELEGFAGEPMDILVNGYLIAQGEVVVVEDKYGIRINEIVNRAERIHKLNR